MNINTLFNHQSIILPFLHSSLSRASVKINDPLHQTYITSHWETERTRHEENHTRCSCVECAMAMQNTFFSGQLNG